MKETLLTWLDNIESEMRRSTAFTVFIVSVAVIVYLALFISLMLSVYWICPCKSLLTFLSGFGGAYGGIVLVIWVTNVRGNRK